MKRPNKLLYGFVSIIARLYTSITKNHHLSNKDKIKIKTPSLVISNHTSFFDFLYVMGACKMVPINFVVARKYYETKPLSKILTVGQTIPKSLFQPDAYAMKKMLEVIRNEGVVGMFPEGQISITGVTLPFPSTIGKLVKKTGINVYGVKTKGAYLKNPPWTNIKRKGRIDSEVFQVLSSEEIEKLTATEIESILYNSIYVNPYLNPAKLYPSKNLAIGLNHLLYLCPDCYHEGMMKSINNDLICEHCDSKFRVLSNGFLVDKNHHQYSIDEIYQKERAYERLKIINDDNFSFQIKVKVESIQAKKYEIVSNGVFAVSKDEIKYLSDDDYQFNIPTNVVQYVPFDNGQNFQIYRNNVLYQFIPEKPYLCTKATIVIELMYELKFQRQM